MAEKAVEETTMSATTTPDTRKASARLGCFPMPSAEYHADKTAISASGLKTFRRSRREFELGISKEPTEAMNAGTLAHAALLEPEKLETLFPIYPKDILGSNGAINTNAAKEWRDSHIAAGRVPVKREQFDRAAEMVKSIKATIGPWLTKDAICEHAIYWEDEETGLLCKCRPDFLVERRHIILTVDIKTTDDPMPAEFSRRVDQMAHWLQVPHYNAGAKAHFGGEPDFMFAAVESDWPFRTVVHQLSQADAFAAKMTWNVHMANLKKCKETGDFADPWEGRVNELTVKPWTIS